MRQSLGRPGTKFSSQWQPFRATDHLVGCELGWARNDHHECMVSLGQKGVFVVEGLLFSCAQTS